MTVSRCKSTGVGQWMGNDGHELQPKGVPRGDALAPIAIFASPLPEHLNQLAPTRGAQAPKPPRPSIRPMTPGRVIPDALPPNRNTGSTQLSHSACQDRRFKSGGRYPAWARGFPWRSR